MPDTFFTPVQLVSGFCLGLILFSYKVWNDGHKKIIPSLLCLSSIIPFIISIPLSCGLFLLQDYAYIPIFIGIVFLISLLAYRMCYEPFKLESDIKKRFERE